jgi:hypothetical protein
MTTKIISTGGSGRRGWGNSGSTPPAPHDHYRLVAQTSGTILLFTSTAGDNGQLSIGGVNTLRENSTLSNFFIGQGGNDTASGSGNIGIGFESLENIDDGSFNYAMGYHAATNLVSGSFNVAMGNLSFYTASSGSYNTAVGSESLFNSTSGHDNTAVGRRALYTVSTGFFNVGVGNSSLLTAEGSMNSAMGYFSGTKITSGSQNVFIGFGAGNSASQKVDAVNTTALGSNTWTDADNQTVVGNTSVTSIRLRGNVSLDSGATTYGNISAHTGGGMDIYNTGSGIPITITSVGDFFAYGQNSLMEAQNGIASILSTNDYTNIEANSGQIYIDSDEEIYMYTNDDGKKIEISTDGDASDIVINTKNDGKIRLIATGSSANIEISGNAVDISANTSTMALNSQDDMTLTAIQHDITLNAQSHRFPWRHSVKRTTWRPGCLEA